MAVSHFAYPFAMGGTSFSVREQDTPEEITDCVKVCVLTPVGSRMAAPTYGAPEVLYGQEPALTPDVLAAITLWEPRATVALAGMLDATDPGTLHASVTVRGGRR